MLAQIIRNRLDSAAKLGGDSRFFAANEAFRSRGLSARTSSPRRSNASALSGSANRSAFARYAIPHGY